MPKEGPAITGEGLLTAAAEALAEDAGGLGAAASSITSGARAAGVAPEAARGFTAVASAFSAGDAPADGEPVRSDQDLVTAAELLESDASDMLAALRRLQGDIARAAEDAVRSMDDARGSDLSADEIAQVNDRAVRILGDCDTAAEIADDLSARLTWAIARLADVPADVGVTYESVYQLLARGGVLPYAGDWLTSLLSSPTVTVTAGTPGGGYEATP